MHTKHSGTATGKSARGAAEDAEGAEDAEAEAEDAEEDEEEDDDGRVGGTRVYRIPPKHCSSVSVSR